MERDALHLQQQTDEMAAALDQEEAEATRVAIQVEQKRQALAAQKKYMQQHAEIQSSQFKAMQTAHTDSLLAEATQAVAGAAAVPAQQVCSQPDSTTEVAALLASGTDPLAWLRNEEAIRTGQKEVAVAKARVQAAKTEHAEAAYFQAYHAQAQSTVQALGGYTQEEAEVATNPADLVRDLHARVLHVLGHHLCHRGTQQPGVLGLLCGGEAN